MAKVSKKFAAELSTVDWVENHHATFLLLFAPPFPLFLWSLAKKKAERRKNYQSGAILLKDVAISTVSRSVAKHTAVIVTR